MAFPFEPTQLRAQLRAFALSTTDDTNSAARIVKPLVLGLYYEQYNQEYLKNFRSISPPIPSELPVDAGNRPPLQLGHRKRLSRKAPNKATTKTSHKRTASQAQELPSERPRNTQDRGNFSEAMLSVATIGEESDLNTISEAGKKEKKRPKDKLRNPLTKLFQKNDEARRNDDSDSSSGQITLESDHEGGRSPTNSSSLLILPSDVHNRLERQKMEDGQLVIVAEMETGHAPTLNERNRSIDDSFAEDSDDVNTVEDSIIEDELEESSSDSAFTDIEADSMMEGASIYEYTVPESYVLEEAKSKYDPKKKGRKIKRSSGSLLGKSGKALAPNSLLADAGVDGYSKSSSIRWDKSAPILPRRSSFAFEKIYNKVDSEPKQSNLSLLIDSRQHSANVNVLNYYSFVNSDLVDAQKAKIDIYVPPATAPVFNDMEFSVNVPITDCIGYILLSLSKLPEYKDKQDVIFMNPNNWRLELIDEDGELYDSTFGVLDRTRLLSSYNSPNLLALCRVTNPAEVASNNKQSPLPLEFKQSLELKKQRMESAKASSNPVELPGAANLNDDSIEVKVKNLPNTSGNTFISFFVNSKMTVEQFIDHISRLYHVDPTKYKLAELAPANKKQKSTMLIDVPEKDEWQNIAGNSDVLADLATQKFKLVPNQAQHVRQHSEVKLNPLSFSEAAITPSSSSAPLAITPPVATLEGKLNEAIDNSKDQSQSEGSKAQPPGKDTATPKLGKDLLTFGDILHAKTTQLPTSLNTIYFKWKVFRKKSPILNRIEKALILDGDHIHLAPTDDTNWKKNLYDNPFQSGSTTGNSNGTANSHHHHHYLHHYNYSKYYNSTMMKTSSFHIAQIIKLKQYKQSKNPNHFKIVIRKEYDQGGKETVVKKKYDLEAEDVSQCEEIIEKIKWALQVYHMSNVS